MFLISRKAHLRSDRGAPGDLETAPLSESLLHYTRDFDFPIFQAVRPQNGGAIEGEWHQAR